MGTATGSMQTVKVSAAVLVVAMELFVAIALLVLAFSI
jgi:hypothetical protein